MDRIDQIKLEEYEIKPNRLAAHGMLLLGIFGICIWMLNEAGLFMVEKDNMRLVGFVAVTMIALVQMVRGSQKLAGCSYTKYFLMCLCLVCTFIILVGLYQWASMLILLPMTISIAYANRRICVMAYMGSIVIAVIAPILGAIKGFWSLDYFTMIMNMLGANVPDAVIVGEMDIEILSAEFIKHMALPSILLFTGYFFFVMSFIKVRKEHIENRINMIVMEEKDLVSGLYNRMSLKRRIDEGRYSQNVVRHYVYMDMHGLCDINARSGYFAGDEMVAKSAEALMEQFGEDNCYRLSGGSLIAIVDESQSSDLGFQVENLRKTIRFMGFNQWSIGIYTAPADASIRDSILKSENIMREDRAAFYQNEKNDRRNKL